MILALDPATKCGWATDTAYGVWNLLPKRDESKGMRLIRLKAKLKEVCSVDDITIIVFERPGGRFKGPIVVHSELQGVIKLFAEENNLEYRGYSSGEIKKFATGKGNANKAMMIAYAKEKLGYTGDSDDEADALWLLELAKSDLKL